MNVELKKNLNSFFFTYVIKNHSYLNIISDSVPLNPPDAGKAPVLVHSEINKILTMVSCTDNGGGGGLSSLALGSFLSLQDQRQSVLFLPRLV